MNVQQLETDIEAIWENGDKDGPARAAVTQALNALDSGALRVASSDGAGSWTTHAWLKKAVLLSFRLNDMRVFEHTGFGNAWDKVPLKTANWSEEDFIRAGFRMVPPASVRHGAYIAPDVVLMPSFVNIGAYVGQGTMVDTWASIGSCAQVGAHCHISAGTGIGGVLEPLQANPVIIEDNVFVGARSEVVEGVIVREGSVLAMGVFITQSTKIVDRATGKITRGEVPPYSVVVPGTLPDPKGGPSLACAVIVKTVDERTRAKTGINALLRD
ncbi:MAG: 2,3,4,5-tetrahydropyridine-2,6-dicarboxylate N-succinyltransferase [Robiginitomaculum sp.]|nr:MAG: 2,3,4,5-tetrahydropyridine-2,6-dicarboxylate N-succinyltransferase [Robiginitomaculum sp.]